MERTSTADEWYRPQQRVKLSHRECGVYMLPESWINCRRPVEVRHVKFSACSHGAHACDQGRYPKLIRVRVQRTCRIFLMYSYLYILTCTGLAK